MAAADIKVWSTTIPTGNDVWLRNAQKIGNPALTKWRQGGLQNKKMLFSGDSTTNPAMIHQVMIDNFTAAGQQLEGVTCLDGGETGATLAMFLADTMAVCGISWVCAQYFDVLVLCWGINDVKNGSTSTAQMVSMLRTAVTTIHAARPLAEIILWTPNSFLTTDVGGNGFITSATSPQTATDVLAKAYDSLIGAWPTYVSHISKMDVHGRTCPSLSPLMDDQVHPSPAGRIAACQPLANLLARDGWPYAAGTDPYWQDTVLLLNGNALVDATGRHTLTATNGTVTSDGTMLVFDGTDSLTISDNLADFDFGANDGALQDNGYMTIEGLLERPSAGNPAAIFGNENVSGTFAIYLDGGPTYTLTLSGTDNPNPPGQNMTGIAPGVPVPFAICYGDDQISIYVNGTRVYLNYDFATYNAASTSPMAIGLPTSGWTLRFFTGRMRLRVTRANRYGHAASYTVPSGFFPTNVTSSAAALASAVQAVSTVSAALTTAIPLASAAQAVTTLTAGLTTAIRPAAAVSSACTLTAGLTTAIPLAASASSVCTLTAALAAGAAALAADAQAQTTVTAALSTAISLAATPQAVTTLSAALSTSIALAGAAQAVTTVAAALTTAIPLAAAASGVCTVTATLSGGAAALASAAQAQTTLTAALSTAIRFAAAPVSVTTLSAALSTSITLAAAATGACTVTAALTTAITPAAAVASVCTVGAALSTAIPLAAAASTVCTLTANLSGGAALSSAAQAQTTVTAALSTAIRLTAAASGSCTVTAALTTGIALAASASGVCTLSAALTSGGVLFASAVQGQTTVSASLSTAIRLATQVIARAQVTAELTAISATVLGSIAGRPRATFATRRNVQTSERR